MAKISRDFAISILGNSLFTEYWEIPNHELITSCVGSVLTVKDIDGLLDVFGEYIENYLSTVSSDNITFNLMDTDPNKWISIDNDSMNFFNIERGFDDDYNINFHSRFTPKNKLFRFRSMEVNNSNLIKVLDRIEHITFNEILQLFPNLSSDSILGRMTCVCNNHIKLGGDILE